jgi:hypothetical protein
MPRTVGQQRRRPSEQIKSTVRGIDHSDPGLLLARLHGQEAVQEEEEFRRRSL